jgi:hypothetical protein
MASHTGSAGGARNNARGSWARARLLEEAMRARVHLEAPVRSSAEIDTRLRRRLKASCMECGTRRQSTRVDDTIHAHHMSRLVTAQETPVNSSGLPTSVGCGRVAGGLDLD